MLSIPSRILRQAAESEGKNAENSGLATSRKEAHISVPHFPPYGEVRHLLRIWEGQSRKQITRLRQAIWNLTGTPQDVVDWTKPDKWITERLEGENHELAEAIWKRSDGAVNPRYTYGHWSLIQKHNLLDEAAGGKLRLTEDGQEFLNHNDGQTVQHLDKQEGLIALLSLVKIKEPVHVGGIREDWVRHLERNSNFRSPATFRTALVSRINNLLERNLIERDGVRYSLTGEGSAYFGRFDDGENSDDITLEFQKSLKLQENRTRENLLARLLKMDPRTFEYLVQFLLDKMGYENVAVTKSSGDGGVDVIASIEVGITSVKEVVQVKRHRRTIQRKELDALRGSLHRFGAVRGTIVATSKFTSGTKKAALEQGAAPITLIDGEKLVELLIEHKIGVRKHTIHLPDPLPEFETDESGRD